MTGARAPVEPGADVDVLIVGAGPAGLALACDLARRGVAFRLVERRERPLIASRGKGLQPRTLEVLEDLGVLPDILRLSAAYPPMRTLQGHAVLEERPFAGTFEATPDVPYPNMLMAAQWHTEAVLRARLTALGGGVETGVAFTTLVQDADGVTALLATTSGAQTVRARYLVGADGARSPVREALGIAFRGEALEGPRYMFGDVILEGLDREAWSTWRGAAGMLGLCPLPHTDRFQLMISLRPGEDPAPDLETVRALVKARSERDDIHVVSVEWLSVFAPSLALAEHYGVGRGFLIGDAAHVHPPTGAQGLNTSIQDAYNLGWKLALVVDGAAPRLLETYEEERHPVGRSVLSLVAGLSGASSGLSVRGRATQQLDLTYRGSRLARQGGEPGAVAAGDRAPDAPYAAAAGPGRLFEAFQGPHFTLLLFGAAPDQVGMDGLPVRTVRLPAAGPAALAYAITADGLVLVRPDGYLAIHDAKPTPDAVARWFAEVLDEAHAA